MNERYLAELLNYLSDLEFEVTDESFKFVLRDGFDNERIDRLLEESGYIGNGRNARVGNVLQLRKAGHVWDTGECPVYEGWEQFFEKCSIKSDIPESFLVLDSQGDRGLDKQRVEKIRSFIQLRKLLAGIADHCWPEDGIGAGSDKILILISSDSDTHRYEFVPKASWGDVLSIEDEIDSYRCICDLNSLISLGDNQDAERISLIRSSFHDLVNGLSDKKDVFLKVLNNIPILHKTYLLHHEIYVQNFSVNKSLAEINKKRLEFSSSITEIVSGNQAKALAVPGALVLLGAVMKINDLWDGLAVLVGMFMTMAIVYKSFDIYGKSFVYLKDQIVDEFSVYDFLSEESDVRSKSIKVKDELLSMVSDAEDGLRFIKQVIATTVAVAFIYVVTSLAQSL